jgi:exosortase A
MLYSRRRLLGFLLAVALVVAGIVYRDTYVSIVEKWKDDAAYSYGLLILPICLWLIWRKRAALAGLAMAPTWLGVMAVLSCAAVWIIARGAGVLVAEQYAAVALVPALVMAILGWPVTRCLSFPLGFLLLAVPFGRGLVPWMMQLTAEVSTLALRWTGIPVMRSHMYISIPAGSFEVARACSGVNYVVTGLVLGVLYAHLTYRSAAKRLACIAAFLVVPILANGIRVYVTILVSHLTDMRFGPGTEHITFGRVFFVLVMLVMFWIGRTWRDDEPAPEVAGAGSESRSPPLGPTAWMPVPMALAAMLLAPHYLATSQALAAAQLQDIGAAVTLPAGRHGWQASSQKGVGWRPLYRDGLVERQGSYGRAGGAAVDVFVAVYGLGSSHGAEMISYDNLLFPEERGSLAEVKTLSIPLPDGRELEVREVVAPNAGAPQLVWYWFMVGERKLQNAFQVKAFEAIAFVTRGAGSERIVTLATPEDGESRQRLTAFVAAYAGCIEAGFATEACRG